VAAKNATAVLILPPFTKPNRIQGVMDAVAKEKVSCEFRVIPSYDDITAGRVDVNQIRRVEIEDLLERPPYELDLERMRSFVEGKKILVTGAGGSIGSEICRQLMGLGPRALVLFEQSEYHLFQIERELAEKHGGKRMIAFAGDVLREEAVRSAVQTAEGVDVIYHAAAYKHVNLMERNAVACFQNNVIGTEQVARLAEELGVGDFVLISSDKAVRPSSLMGASKRLAERLLMERPTNGTRFKAVRFGNVLGSSGSVVPIFREQIARGGPVTVTSPEVTRYFMTIPEAVELVLAAGAIGEDRRICVLEMGEPVKIDTLARRMIELSGFSPGEEIAIEYVGLRPGEKEYEELLTDDEGVERTDHDRIWVVKKNDDVMADRVDLERMMELVEEGDGGRLRDFAHGLIIGSQLKS
jgi:FlaA1/EpsC-like NDP-sugar epimerase